LIDQQRKLEASKLSYYGKLDLARTYEELGQEIPRELREVIRKKFVLLQNKGAI
jgi:hypothetical protein